VRCAGLDEVIRMSDVVSLHVPLVDSTRGLFDAERIASMKRGAVLINTARGGIVDEVALAAALKSGHLGGAAIDVFEHRAAAGGGALPGCPNLVLTPHIAGVTAEANERVSFLIADKVLEALHEMPAAEDQALEQRRLAAGRAPRRPWPTAPRARWCWPRRRAWARTA
jgi:(S)-sulfolactate dehydrogenase